MKMYYNVLSKRQSYLCAILLFFCFSFVFAQTSINGLVSDTNGIPLPGANVIEKGTSNGVQTDFDGNYTLTTTNTNATLVISYVGYVSTEVQINGQSVVNVALKEDVAQLDAVVIIGYGTAKKSDVTGAMSSVKAEDFNRGVTISPQQLLQGKAAGVNITQSSGEPGANTNVTIRGANSINLGNQPLYVIDGIPVSFSTSNFGGSQDSNQRVSRTRKNPLNMINSSDIASIDVLKDASATAIYGARAANGVILVTTKSGKQGKTVVNYDTYTGISNIRKKLDVFTADELRAYTTANDIPFPVRTDFTEAGGNGGDGGHNTDWQDEIFQTAIATSNNLALSGGNKKTNFRTSLGYLSQDGIILGSNIKNLNSRVNINSKFLDDKLNMTLNIITSNEKSDNAPIVSSTGAEAGGDVIKDALRANPTLPVRDGNGGFTYLQTFVFNPVEEALMLQNETETNRTLANLTANLELREDLNFITHVGVTREDTRNHVFIPAATRPGEQTGGVARLQSDLGESDIIELTLDYHKEELFDNHSLKFLAGYSWQEFRNESMFTQRRGFSQDILGFNNIEDGAIIDAATSGAGVSQLASVFGRLNYDINNKYLLTATWRRDGSSRLANQWDNFRSVAVGWKISEENFLRDSKVIRQLKLRAGWGETGNQGIPGNQVFPTIRTNTSVNPNVGSIAVPNSVGNPDLKWETTIQSNIGLDYGLFEGRISGSIEYYVKQTEDLLSRRNHPSAFNPAPNLFVNIGSVENKGYEFDIDANIVQRENFNFSFYGNIAFNDNIITNWSNAAFPENFLDQVGVPSTAQSGLLIRQQEGMPINSYFMLEFLGFDSNGEEAFRDINNDGAITPDDRQFVGDANPDFTYGFGFNMNAGAFSLSTSFRGIQGGYLYNAIRNELEDITKLPSINGLRSSLLGGQSTEPRNVASTRFLEDASFLRLDNVNLGYDVDVNNVPYLSGLNIYATGQNLFVLTEYSGYDPEVFRVDFTTFPKPSTYLLGLRAKF